MSGGALIVHRGSLAASELELIQEICGRRPEKMAGFYRAGADAVLNRETLDRLGSRLNTDVSQLPADFNPASVRLLVSDMDSTFINIECIDEIADLAGVKSEVAAITRAAMGGKLDFASALRQRVAQLEGLPVSGLQTVVEQRLRLNPGAKAMLRTLENRGIRTALVSGGFTYFTGILKQRYGLDYTLANELEISHGVLTGNVLGRIVDGDVKAGFIREIRAALGISDAQVVAIGDGANDAAMLSEAGLGIAYHAREALRSRADVTLDHSDLSAVAHFLMAADPAGDSS